MFKRLKKFKDKLAQKIKRKKFKKSTKILISIGLIFLGAAACAATLPIALIIHPAALLMIIGGGLLIGIGLKVLLDAAAEDKNFPQIETKNLEKDNNSYPLEPDFKFEPSLDNNLQHENTVYLIEKQPLLKKNSFNNKDKTSKQYTFFADNKNSNEFSEEKINELVEKWENDNKKRRYSH